MSPALVNYHPYTLMSVTQNTLILDTMPNPKFLQVGGM